MFYIAYPTDERANGWMDKPGSQRLDLMAYHGAGGGGGGGGWGSLIFSSCAVWTQHLLLAPKIPGTSGIPINIRNFTVPQKYSHSAYLLHTCNLFIFLTPPPPPKKKKKKKKKKTKIVTPPPPPKKKKKKKKMVRSYVGERFNNRCV